MKKIQGIRLLFEYIKQTWKANRIITILAVVCRIGLAIGFTLETILVANIIDDLVKYTNGQSNAVVVLSSSILALWCIDFALQTSIVRLDERLQNSLSIYLSMNILNKKMKIRYECLEQRDTQELLQRIKSDPSKQWFGCFSSIIELCSYFIKIAGLLIVIATQHFLLSFFVAVLIIPFYYIAMKNGSDEYDAYEESEEHFRRAEYYKKVLSSRENAEERMLFNISAWINSLWKKEYQSAINIETRVNKRIFVRTGLANVVSLVLLGLIAVVLLIPLSNSVITVGLYISLIKSVITYIELLAMSFSGTIAKIEQGKKYINDFFVFSNLSEDADELIDDCSFECNEIVKIDFENVSFAYPNSTKKVFNNLSFSMDGKKKYALVGDNGAGKTTLIKLLTGFYREYRGSIKINEKDIRMIKCEKLQNMFSVVSQNHAKYEMSIRKNLAPNHEYKEEDLWKILDSVNLLQKVELLNEGLDSHLGKLKDNGTDFSIGQWQRLVIARSLLSEALIYVLDEPTATVDPIHEAELYKLFLQELKERFAIFITHRLGAIKSVDCIIVLSSGKVAEQGTHEELMRRKGIYYRMYEEQRSWYIDEKEYNSQDI